MPEAEMQEHIREERPGFGDKKRNRSGQRQPLRKNPVRNINHKKPCHGFHQYKGDEYNYIDEQ
jgi:hypothetical protein